MRIIFIVQHPVDPYIIINTAKSIKKKGGSVYFIIVEKENIIENIVDSHGFLFTVVGRSKKSFVGKVLNSVLVIPKIRKIVNKFKPDIIFSPRSPYASYALKSINVPLIGWEDTETGTFSYNNSIWRIDSLLMPESYYLNKSSDKIIRFNGYKELAYLHPNVFKADSSVLDSMGLKESDTIILMRFSALYAMHDIGLKSVVLENENKILKFITDVELKFNAKVFISMTERSLSSNFEKYRLNIPPSKYLHFLFFCSLYIGEGTTTASEAGVLGVPWINIQQTKRGYLIDQEENYGLGFRTDSISDALRKAEKYLNNKNIKNEWEIKRNKLINDKINVSEFITWFLVNYPESHRIMKNNPEYQNRFK